MTRVLWFGLGWIAVALGLLGVVLPGLPTTPFLLAAALSFSRSSPRMQFWLENHPQFGPPIRDWEDRGAISARAKTLAVAMMGLVFAISLVLAMPGWVLAVQAVGMGGAALFILTRPD